MIFLLPPGIKKLNQLIVKNLLHSNQRNFLTHKTTGDGKLIIIDIIASSGFFTEITIFLKKNCDFNTGVKRAYSTYDFKNFYFQP